MCKVQEKGSAESSQKTLGQGASEGQSSGTRDLNVYIASSWKNEWSVRFLTVLLRQKGYLVHSFVEQAKKTEKRLILEGALSESFNSWVWSKAGEEKFLYDIDWARNADVVIYLGPSGTDAWAEVSAAWSSGVPVLGLGSSGDTFGLMRRMVIWITSLDHLFTEIAEYHKGVYSRGKRYRERR